MKRINEITTNDCQKILVELFGKSKAHFEDLIELNGNVKGIRYTLPNKIYTPENKQTFSLIFNDPEVLPKLYHMEYDISEPLNEMRHEYLEMDELNNIFFEHITSIEEILNDKKITNDEKIEELIKLRGELAKKI